MHALAAGLVVALCIAPPALAQQVGGERVVLRAATSLDLSGLRGGGESVAAAAWRGKDSRVADPRTVDAEAGVVLRTDAKLPPFGDTGAVMAGLRQQNRQLEAISADAPPRPRLARVRPSAFDGWRR